MNANQMINMILRMVMRQVMRRGVNAGIDAVTNRRQKDDGAGQDAPKRKGHDTAQTQRRMRQSMRAVKRMNRF